MWIAVSAPIGDAARLVHSGADIHRDTHPSPLAPSLDVTPLIPELSTGGGLDMLQENGATAFAFPSSKAFDMFSPFGNGFRSAPVVNNTATSLVPAGGATTEWSLGGWEGDDIWVVEETGCPESGTGTTAAFIAHEGTTTLTPVQPALGSGCVLTAVALDGSMPCVAQPRW